MAEEIINRLTKVIGRTSSFSFKEKDTDLKTIGEMLGVETILEGSVQKSGNQLRITVQLINADDGFHIWSERFDREFSDVFSIQDELAQLVVSKMLNVPAQENKIIYTNEKISSEAYDLFLKGKHIHRSQYSIYNKIEDFNTAEKMFFDALIIEPNYALAHAGLADLYNSITYINKYIDFPEMQKYMDLQKKHMVKSFQIDPFSDYVNEVKGWVYTRFEEYDSAYYSFLKAIQLNPNESDNIFALADFYAGLGLYYNALIFYDKANEIDPLDVNNLSGRAVTNAILGNWEMSMNDVNEMILIEPNLPVAYIRKLELFISLDKIYEAQEMLIKCRELNSEIERISNTLYLIVLCKHFYQAILITCNDINNS